MQEPMSRLTPPGATLAEDSRLSIFVHKLLRQTRLSSIDQQQLAALPVQIRELPAQAIILREGDHASVCPILLSGIAYRYKIAADGGRQIVSLRIPGDPLDFQSLYLRTIDHHMQSLTPVTLALVPLPALEKLAETKPSIARAILIDILIEASIGREWQLNIGRRQALPRLAHFLCEYVHRNRLIFPQIDQEVDIPITQEQLADILGLTPVHVNRTLKTLEQAGAVVRSKRRLTTRDLSALERLADYSPLYLHPNNAG